MKLSEQIRGIAHVGIPVSDAEEAARSYEKLGFRRLACYPFPGTGRRAVFVEARDGSVFELYESSREGYSGVIDHVALAVDDIELARASADDEGLEILSTGIGKMDGDEWKARYFTVRMPGGETLEINQKL